MRTSTMCLILESDIVFRKVPFYLAGSSKSLHRPDALKEAGRLSLPWRRCAANFVRWNLRPMPLHRRSSACFISKWRMTNSAKSTSKPWCLRRQTQLLYTRVEGLEQQLVMEVAIALLLTTSSSPPSSAMDPPNPSASIAKHRRELGPLPASGMLPAPDSCSTRFSGTHVDV